MLQNRLTLILFFIFITVSEGQNITGRISDSENKAIEGAYLFNKKTKTHAHSRENGTFILLNNTVGDTLQVSILGYKTKTIVVSNTDLTTEIVINLENNIFKLEEFVISREINPLKTIAQLDLKTSPVNSSQEILRKVPGLFIGQHAGGGKAEQLFLRGFDIDHGTDVNISVDGVPVNMVSHAHGQGYSDLHFLIPETIEKIDFGKGPYYAENGDFSTAAYVKFKTKESVKNNSITFSYGQFNALRTLGLFNLVDKNNTQNAFVAIEYLANDGPFISPQNFNRLNIFSKYSSFLNDKNKIALTVSHFSSRWDASGQIPQREIDNGNISRFGSIDDTEGGATQRTNINAENTFFSSENTTIKTNVFYSKYDFELFSNFTFFLDDPINGDQIKQKENRSIYGFNTQRINNKTFGNFKSTFILGTGLRNDATKNTELSHTLNRNKIITPIKLGDINQTNLYLFCNYELSYGKLKIAPSLRLDHFKFMYTDLLSETYKTDAVSKSVISPKLNFVYNTSNAIQWFLKTGIGFHSNDARVVVKSNGQNILPKVYGADFGSIWKPFNKLIVNTALWYLYAEQELVYVGDAGIVEPKSKTQRYGIDLGLRYQLNKYLYFDTDATFTKARSLTETKGSDYIPLAPITTIAVGLSLSDYKGFSGSLRTRFLGDRPANENYSITAKGYMITDFNINYQIQKITFGVTVENLFNVAWNETQFATESRLKNETESVEEIHFTPGVPFFIKTNITYTF